MYVKPLMESIKVNPVEKIQQDNEMGADGVSRGKGRPAGVSLKRRHLNET